MSLSSPLPLHDAVLTPAALPPLTGEGDSSHSRPEQGSCQQQCCNCHARCKLMYHIVRASMKNFLAPEEVPFQRQDSPPVRDISSCIHMRACEISVQGSFAQPVVVHQRRYQRTSCPALTQLLHLRRSQRMLAAKPYTPRSRALTEPTVFMREGRCIPRGVQTQCLTDEQVRGLHTIHLHDLWSASPAWHQGSRGHPCEHPGRRRRRRLSCVAWPRRIRRA
jgi:hypothetical protein